MKKFVYCNDCYLLNEELDYIINSLTEFTKKDWQCVNDFFWQSSDVAKIILRQLKKAFYECKNKVLKPNSVYILEDCKIFYKPKDGGFDVKSEKIIPSKYGDGGLTCFAIVTNDNCDVKLTIGHKIFPKTGAPFVSENIKHYLSHKGILECDINFAFFKALNEH